jgi:acetyl-CoA carboxylase carboxyl transferase subunit alpha
VITGLGEINGKKVIFIGQMKGKITKEKIYHNFGMLHPEGYRKALRVMKLGEKFSKPIIVLIDTPGAYPGIGAEERGQAQAIAKNIMEMSGLKTPIIVIIIGEGGSGGALGLGVGDVVLMQEYSFYSVISPEGCASILWRDATQVEKAATYLHITPQELLKLKVIDEIIKEPIGGAHRNPKEAAEEIKKTILKYLNHFSQKKIEEVIKSRQKKFETLGIFIE